jgi:acyl carrier protein
MAFKSSWFKFKALVCEYIDADFLSTRPYSTWEDLGLDSLDFVELITMVEEEYNVEFTDLAVDDIKTIGGLHGLLVRKLDSQREVDITHRDSVNTRCSHCGRS